MSLDACPLPSSALGLQTVPKSLPDRWGEQARLWCILECHFCQSLSHTCPTIWSTSCSHPQFSPKRSSSGLRSLPSRNASGPIRPLPKPAPSSNNASSSNRAQVIDLGNELRFAVVHVNDSRFATAPSNPNQSTMG